jgi:thymidylate kinase
LYGASEQTAKMIVPYLVIYGMLGPEVAMRRIAEEAEVVARLDYEKERKQHHGSVVAAYVKENA